MATLFNAFFQQVDSNGNPLSGAKLYFYQTGTSTLQNTYSQSDLAIAHVNANPVVADSNGRWGPIYLGTAADYKVILKDSTDTTISTIDPYFASATDNRTQVADTSYAAAVTDRVIAYTTLTASRTITLPLAANFPAGTTLEVVDEAGGATSAVTLSFARSGSDTINGGTSNVVVVSQAYGLGAIESNGSTKWTILRKTLSTNSTVQDLTSGSAATYTTATGAVRLKIRIVGGGGGGGGTGATTGPTGGTGGTTSFNSITAVGGTGGPGSTAAAFAFQGGAGGTGGTGSAALRITGAAGHSPTNINTVVGNSGAGGSSVFGGAGASVDNFGNSFNGSTGAAAAANTGSGGAGAVGTNGTSYSGAGGGAGEYAEIIINNPSATYTYTVGASGAGGIGTGTGAFTGGAGAAGRIVVEEFYT